MIDRERRKAFIEGPLQEAAQVADENVSYLDYFDAGGVEGVIIVYEDDSKAEITIEGKDLAEVGIDIFTRLLENASSYPASSGRLFAKS